MKTINETEAKRSVSSLIKRNLSGNKTVEFRNFKIETYSHAGACYRRLVEKEFSWSWEKTILRCRFPKGSDFKFDFFDCSDLAWVTRLKEQETEKKSRKLISSVIKAYIRHSGDRVQLGSFSIGMYYSYGVYCHRLVENLSKSKKSILRCRLSNGADFEFDFFDCSSFAWVKRLDREVRHYFKERGL